MLPDLADPEQLLPQLARLHLTDLGYVLFAGALVSAILSTVDSALLVASSLLSRNLVLAGSPDASQRKRLAIARGGVALFGLVAWWLAHRSDGVFDLVEQASGFGSAGILVIVVFGLFTTFGRAGAAFAALVGGSAAWVVGRYVVADFELPYLVSLGVALSAYVGIGILGRRYTDRGGP
jgi:Na+/proline symporter